VDKERELPRIEPREDGGLVLYYCDPSGAGMVREYAHGSWGPEHYYIPSSTRIVQGADARIDEVPEKIARLGFQYGIGFNDIAEYGENLRGCWIKTYAGRLAMTSNDRMNWPVVRAPSRSDIFAESIDTRWK
jgi:hypothetical protein